MDPKIDIYTLFEQLPHAVKGRRLQEIIEEVNRSAAEREACPGHKIVTRDGALVCTVCGWTPSPVQARIYAQGLRHGRTQPP